MKGLMIKDLCLLRNQKKLLLILLILAVWFTVMNNDGFAFPFMAMMASVMTVSTLSYDEVDKSQTHLFTLPFDRRTYVTEKFLLGSALLLAFQALGCLCVLVRGIVSPGAGNGSFGLYLFFVVCAGVVMLSVMIPVRIRFGDDQGRIIFYVVFALAALICLGLKWLIPDIEEKIGGIFTSGARIIAFTAAAAAAVAAGGFLTAVRWIKTKEF